MLINMYRLLTKGVFRAFNISLWFNKNREFLILVEKTPDTDNIA